MRLVLASGNRGKLAELRGLLGDLPLSLQALAISPPRRPRKRRPASSRTPS